MCNVTAVVLFFRRLDTPEKLRCLDRYRAFLETDAKKACEKLGVASKSASQAAAHSGTVCRAEALNAGPRLSHRPPPTIKIARGIPFCGVQDCGGPRGGE